VRVEKIKLCPSMPSMEGRRGFEGRRILRRRI